MSLNDLIESDVLGVFLATTDFAEEVTLLIDAGNQVVVCLVERDTPIVNSDGDKQTEYTGRIRYPTTEIEHLDLDGTPVQTASIDEEVWHLLGVGPDQDGITTIETIRHSTETKHSGTFDLNENQLRW